MRLVLPIVKGLLRGDRRSLARAISIVDNEESSSELIIHQIFNKTGNARTVGFTGPGGAGKSSLISKLVAEFQNLGYRVAVSCSRSYKSYHRWRNVRRSRQNARHVGR